MNLYELATQELKKRRGNVIDIPAPPTEPVHQEEFSDAFMEQSMQMLQELDAQAILEGEGQGGLTPQPEPQPTPQPTSQPKRQTPFQQHVQQVVNNSAKSAELERQELTPVRESFLQTLAHLENGVRDGWSESERVWRPHDSREQGRQTLAYGHKLTKEEVETGKVYIGGKAYSIEEGIPEDKAWQLFTEDFDKSFRKAKKTFGTVWEHIDPRVKMLAAEINFNVTGGLGGFPNFQKAAKDLNNPSSSLSEISRTYSYRDKTGNKVTKPLENRVNALADWFKNYKE